MERFHGQFETLKVLDVEEVRVLVQSPDFIDKSMDMILYPHKKSEAA